METWMARALRRMGRERGSGPHRRIIHLAPKNSEQPTSHARLDASAADRKSEGVKCAATTSPSHEQATGISTSTCFCTSGTWLSNSAVTPGLTYYQGVELHQGREAERHHLQASKPHKRC
ncbi:hypothetical protein O3P69_012595 [Scylla paramamosain]|uniref:Uncharacterized protein n=1 Tax=Scylla paramamosain TaxID=85552 RepID=A0AAW0SIM5_SCYPA